MSSGQGPRDPVCGMTVDPLKSQHHAEYEGAVHYFCGGGCRIRFLSDPHKYLYPERTPPQK